MYVMYKYIIFMIVAQMRKDGGWCYLEAKFLDNIEIKLVLIQTRLVYLLSKPLRKYQGKNKKITQKHIVKEMTSELKW